MEAIGIVAEYNPFHKGHLWHIQQTKKTKNLPIIAIISGSIMQRGEPAFADKWLRARMAIECGVDLVLELPTAFSLRSAEFFAKGGVKLLEATGVVSHLSCGAEDANIDYAQLARTVLSPAVQETIHQQLQQGHPYAKACELALAGNCASLQLADIATKPNNILALEYAKTLLNTNIEQIIIARNGSNYNDNELTNLASATAIRKAYSNNDEWQQAVPEIVFKLIESNKNAVGYDEAKLWTLLNYKLRICSAKDIIKTTECNEGLENLLLCAVNATSFEEAVAKCTNKRYPASRIRRLFMQLLMSKPRIYLEQDTPAYLRVLAFNNIGRKLLSVMKQTATLPIITKLGCNPYQRQSVSFKQQLELDITAANIVALLRSEQQNNASDFLTSPYYKKQHQFPTGNLFKDSHQTSLLYTITNQI